MRGSSCAQERGARARVRVRVGRQCSSGVQARANHGEQLRERGRGEEESLKEREDGTERPALGNDGDENPRG